MVRTKENRVKNWTGTVHYANQDGTPACGPVKTADTYMHPSLATVNCERCIAEYGHDEPGHVDVEVPHFADDHAARRAAARAENRETRFPVPSG